MKTTTRSIGAAASRKIDERIEELGDWRGEALARVRKLIHDADPEIQEEWKWMGTPVWSHDGGVCTGESHKQVVKVTFFRGASLEDPKKLFNSSLEGHTRRAIDIREGDKINAPAFKDLIRRAVAANVTARTLAPGRPRGRASQPVAARVEVPIPPDLAAALRDEGVLPAWESLPPGKRAYLLKQIDQAVHEATRAKRIVLAVEEALARHEKGIDRGAR
jgi:hypothetical protein